MYILCLICKYIDVYFRSCVVVEKWFSRHMFQSVIVLTTHRWSRMNYMHFTCCSAWLSDSMNATIDSLSKRISAITHLSMEKAEDLQVKCSYPAFNPLRLIFQRIHKELCNPDILCPQHKHGVLLPSCKHEGHVWVGSVYILSGFPWFVRVGSYALSEPISDLLVSIGINLARRNLFMQYDVMSRNAKKLTKSSKVKKK